MSIWLASEPKSYHKFTDKLFSTLDKISHSSSTLDKISHSRVLTKKKFLFKMVVAKSKLNSKLQAFYQDFVETNKILQQLNGRVCSIEAKLSDLCSIWETLYKLAIASLGKYPIRVADVNNLDILY